MKTTTIGDLINSYIPQNHEIKSEPTVLSITGTQHLENVWSNIYAYFLDERESHGLGTIFLKSLERLISKKTGRAINLSGAFIRREVSTLKGNRIDLLISAPGHSVIIENKVHHHLNNDLDDYWLSVIGGNINKTGIVITISRILMNNPRFINITHLEWINEIEKDIDGRILSSDDSSTILLKDFIYNIKQMSAFTKLSNSEFYLRNRSKINIICETVSKYRNWLQDIFTDKSFIRSLGNFALVHNDWKGSTNRFAMYRIAFDINSPTDELVITVHFEPIWKSDPGKAHFYLHIQPLGKWFDKAVSFQDKIRSIAKSHGLASEKIENDYWHCAGIRINVSEDQLLDSDALKNYLIEYLASPDSKLISTAWQIHDLIIDSHSPTYRWTDALNYLKGLIPDDKDENVGFWCEPVNFISFDPTRQIVILEVIDSFTRNRIERDYYDSLMRAIKYAFGDDARCSIMCRQISY